MIDAKLMDRVVKEVYIRRWAGDPDPQPILWRDSVQDWLAWIVRYEGHEHVRFPTPPLRSGRCIVKVLIPYDNMRSDGFGPCAGVMALNANLNSRHFVQDHAQVVAAHTAFKMGVDVLQVCARLSKTHPGTAHG